MKTLILYYSQAVGNTERIAKMVQERLEADIEKIDTVTPYTGTYNEISHQGHIEVNKGFKPEIKPLNSDIAIYDRIVIATPTWWYSMAPAVLTLLSNIDLNGKEVVLVHTHAGWPGHCLEDMEKQCEGAKIIAKESVQFDQDGGNKIVTPIQEVEEWIDKLK